MKPMFTIVILSIALGGCAKSLVEREAEDDTACRTIIAQRGDSRPDAYKECRTHMMEYRNQKAIAAGGSTTTVITR